MMERSQGGCCAFMVEGGQQGTVATQRRRAVADDGGGGRAGRWEPIDAPAPVIKAGEATHEQRRGGFVIIVVSIVLFRYEWTTIYHIMGFTRPFLA